jgi:hypothetical protein
MWIDGTLVVKSLCTGEKFHPGNDSPEEVAEPLDLCDEKRSEGAAEPKAEPKDLPHKEEVIICNVFSLGFGVF